MNDDMPMYSDDNKVTDASSLNQIVVSLLAEARTTENEFRSRYIEHYGDKGIHDTQITMMINREYRKAHPKTISDFNEKALLEDLSEEELLSRVEILIKNDLSKLRSPRPINWRTAGRILHVVLDKHLTAVVENGVSNG